MPKKAAPKKPKKPKPERRASRAHLRPALALLAVAYAVDALLAVVTAAGGHKGVHVIALGLTCGGCLVAACGLLFRASRPGAPRALLLVAAAAALVQTLEWFFLFRGGFDVGALAAGLLVVPVLSEGLDDDGGLPIASSSAAVTCATVVLLAEVVPIVGAPDAKRALMSGTTFAASEIASAVALVVLFASARARLRGEPANEPPVRDDPAAAKRPLATVVVAVLLRAALSGAFGVAAATRAIDVRSLVQLLPPADAILAVATAAAVLRHARATRGRAATLAWAAVAALVAGAAAEAFAARAAAAARDAQGIDAILDALGKAARLGAAAGGANAIGLLCVAASAAALARAEDLVRLARDARATAILFAVTIPLAIVLPIGGSSLVHDPELQTLAALSGPAIAGLLLGAQVALLRVLAAIARAAPG